MVGGPAPTAPTPVPAPKDQYNFTDPESRIMKAGNGHHFEQSYNAQAAVEVLMPLQQEEPQQVVLVIQAHLRLFLQLLAMVAAVVTVQLEHLQILA